MHERVLSAASDRLEPNTTNSVWSYLSQPAKSGETSKYFKVSLSKLGRAHTPLLGRNAALLGEAATVIGRHHGRGDLSCPRQLYYAFHLASIASKEKHKTTHPPRRIEPVGCERSRAESPATVLARLLDPSATTLAEVTAKCTKCLGW